MQIINANEINSTAFYDVIEYDNIESVNQIINSVRSEGDSALIRISNEFNDGIFNSADDFIVTEDEIKKAYDNVTTAFVDSIKIAHKNVEKFAKAQFGTIKNLDLKYKKSKLGHKIIPLERILAYVPGGNYPLPSSCIMTVTPAKVAGVKEVILTSPRIKPETIVAAHIAGADKIYKIGGAQAISAFAYGTQSIKPVDKIVGPGNKYVTYAKKHVFGRCDIDFLAGPSEVLIVADETANPHMVSSDMLAQCEHDADARAYLITTSKKLAETVEEYGQIYLKSLKTKRIAEVSFNKSVCVLVDNIEQAIEISNKRAPEHLELMFKNADKYKDKFTNYGSLFIGQYCAEVFGDYVSGTNHVLPTNSASKYTAGLSVFDFIKIATYQKIDKSYASELSKTARYLAQTEGLMGHKLASEVRGTDLVKAGKKSLLKTIFPKEKQTQFLAKLVTLYFEFKRHFYYCKNINYPKNQCIFALWHAHQCGLYALETRENTTVMISNSSDGEIIAQAGKAMGLKVVRGSQKNKGAAASLELIEAIKNGSYGALTIDGPRGPKHKVKKGVIEIARMTGVPIVPMSWYSPSPFFFKFKTWDEFCFPMNCIKMKAIYGNPIYIPYNATDEELENYRLQVENELKELYLKLKTDFKKL